LDSNNKTLRFVYPTLGVCPPEIHFQIQAEILKEVRFVGGGCPGNALLVCRLVEGRRVKDVLPFLEEIGCRNGTSCPDQLARALQAAIQGTLEPARSYRIHTDPETRNRIGLIGDLGGRKETLERLIPHIRKEKVDGIYCLGNLTGDSTDNRDLIGLVREEGIFAIQGEMDFVYAQNREPDEFPDLDQRERDYLVRLPQVLSFRIGGRKGMAFFGNYLQDLPGYSDFEHFAVEINMVGDLTNFMQDETVFPALEAMIPQFEAQILLFGQTRKWGRWQIGDVDFISVGSALDADGLSWALLEGNGVGLKTKTIYVR
jgi:uncharacterized protein (TIGR03905 family)